MSRKRKGDWRLPTKEELKKLYDEHSQSSKEMKNKAYWSSTTSASVIGIACFVSFHYGNTQYYDKTYPNHVRCVRKTKNGLKWSKVAGERMTWYDAIKYAKDMNKLKC